ncbi:MAG: hypothetical protein FWE53_03200 [Firmicutes bacterium]|nr:hypothetical protein [Bacillota bacterium]
MKFIKKPTCRLANKDYITNTIKDIIKEGDKEKATVIKIIDDVVIAYNPYTTPIGMRTQVRVSDEYLLDDLVTYFHAADRDNFYKKLSREGSATINIEAGELGQTIDHALKVAKAKDVIVCVEHGVKMHIGPNSDKYQVVNYAWNKSSHDSLYSKYVVDLAEKANDIMNNVKEARHMARTKKAKVKSEAIDGLNNIRGTLKEQKLEK